MMVTYFAKVVLVYDLTEISGKLEQPAYSSQYYTFYN